MLQNRKHILFFFYYQPKESILYRRMQNFLWSTYDLDALIAQQRESMCIGCCIPVIFLLIKDLFECVNELGIVST